MADNPQSRWVTMTEAIAIFGKSERTLRRWVEDGRIEARRERGRVLLLVHVGKADTNRTTAAAPDRTESADITPAELAELKTRLEEVTRQRDYLEQALAAAMSKIPAIEAGAESKTPARPWWKFWK